MCACVQVSRTELDWLVGMSHGRLRTYPATGARDADCSSKSGLAQIGAQIAHSASQSFAQQRSQGGSINITYFGCDGFNVEVATVQQGPRAFDAKILKIRKRRFAKHRFATTLQCACTCRQRVGG